MRTCFAAIITVCNLANAAYGASPPGRNDEALGGRNRYERCLELTRRNAEEALNKAAVWEASGGDGPANHCAALALVALRRYREAAIRLDQLGHASIGSAQQRADVFGQAGNAWLLARRGADATASFSSALALSPRDPDLLADRARAAALLGDWKSADSDLSAALKIDDNRADLLVLRASARRALRRQADARADLELALRILPNYPEALVERGALKLESGDATGAWADWQLAVSRASGTAAAATAQQRLDALLHAKKK
ncbi:MAG: hypothetical protein JO208_11010 [Alphaproteobacteria bacterium]|nr:hypothetical protein [Alphaproteobacteria bacterium]